MFRHTVDDMYRLAANAAQRGLAFYRRRPGTAVTIVLLALIVFTLLRWLVFRSYAPFAIVRIITCGLVLASYHSARMAGDEPPARVPRRFGIGTIFVMLTAFAALFAFLRWAYAPAPLYSLLAGLFFTVGLAQWWLPTERAVRRASIAAGVVDALLVAALAWTLNTGRIPGIIVRVLPEIAALGGLFGYCAGALVAAIFLAMDRINAWSTPANEETRRAGDVSPLFR